MFPIPFAVMMTWPIPNYVDPVTRSSLAHYIPSSIFIFLSAVCLGVRLYQRIWVRRYLGLDDVFIVLAFFFSIGVTIIVTIANKHYGWNRHVWDIPPHMYKPALICLYLVRIFWGQASCFVRLSVLCLYYRLLKSIAAPRRFFWVMHATLAFNIGILLFNLLAGIIPCYPVNTYWAWPPIDSKCLNESISIRSMAVTNTAGELQLAILPILALMRLKIQPKQRWSVISVLSLGFLITVIGIVRTAYVWLALTTYDMTWWAGPNWIAAEVELHTAIICASAPALRPLISRISRKLRQSKRTSRLMRTLRDTKESMHNSSMLRFGEKSQTSTITVNHIHHQADLENASEWASLMCTIDLEGIPDDGLGYTVTITGPPRAKRSSRSTRCRIAALNLLKTHTGSRPSSRNGGAAAEDDTMDEKTAVDAGSRGGRKVLSQVLEEEQVTAALQIPVTVEVEIAQAARPEPASGLPRASSSSYLHEKRWNSFGGGGNGGGSGSGSESQSIVNIDAVMDGYEFTDFGRHLATSPLPHDGGSPTTLSPLTRLNTRSVQDVRAEARAELLARQHRDKSWYNDDDRD